MPPAALDQFRLTLHLAGQCSVVAQPDYSKPSGIKVAPGVSPIQLYELVTDCSWGQDAQVCEQQRHVFCTPCQVSGGASSA